MPMGYHGLIGDMGSSLSGGQKQRIILARALYRQPKLLFLDEAISHLDVDNEQLVNAAIRRLNVTRVIVAHRAGVAVGRCPGCMRAGARQVAPLRECVHAKW